MEIADKTIIENVLKIRVKELKEMKQTILSEYKKNNRNIPDDETLYDLSVSKVSNKKHPKTREQIKQQYSIDDIVVNDGGSQNYKIQQLNKDNKKYVHITSNMIGYKKDQVRGF